MAGTFVQFNDAILTGAGQITTANISYGSANTAGNMLFLTIGWYLSGGNPGVMPEITDTQGNQWIPVPYDLPSSTFPNGQLPGGEVFRAFYVLNCKGGSNTVTINWTTGVFPPHTAGGVNFAGAAIAEYSGVNSFLYVDSGNVGFSTGTSTSPLSFTSASFTGLAIGYGCSATYVNWTAGSGYTLRTTSTAVQLGIQDKNVTSATAVSDFTLGSSTGWGSGLAVFYQATDVYMIQNLDHNDGIAGASPTDVISFAKNISAGSLLFLNYVWVNSPAVTITGITDTQGNTWVSTPIQNLGGLGTSTQAWYVLNAIAGATTITVTFSGSGASFIGMAAAEFANVNTLDQLAIATGNNTAPTSPSVTTTQADELVLTFYATQAGFQNSNIPYPFALAATQNRSVSLGTQFGVGIASYQGAFTQQTSNLWSCGIITFYAGSTPPPSNRNRIRLII